MRKFISILISALLIVGMFAGCTSGKVDEGTTQTDASEATDSPAEDNGEFVAGTYSSTNNGFSGPITVETTFGEDGAITAVEIVQQYETAGIQQAINVVPEAIVENQSIAVDTVSGATFAGFAVINSVKDCIEQAGANVENYSEKIATAPLENRELEADVIVVGAGGAGLSAAVSAHQQGAKVIVLEKIGMPGGSTIFSGGAFNAADPERAKTLTMTDSNMDAIQALLDAETHDEYHESLKNTVAEQFAEFKESGEGMFDSAELHMLQTYTGGDFEGNPDLITTMCENALDTTEWLGDIGADWKADLGMATGALWQRSHYGTEDYPDGFTSVFPYVNYIENNDDIEIHYYTKADELIQEDGKIVGVKATAVREDGEEYTYTADKGVVMATGGFGANVEMRQKYNEQWDNLDETIGCSNQSVSAQGDGIVMGEAVGAELVDMGLIQLHPNGEVGTGMMMGNPHTSGLNRIFVNKDGERFIKEDARRDDTVKAIYAQPEGYMWIVADSTRYPEGTELIDIPVELGKTLKADTVEELAALMEVDAENLQASIDQYNEIVDGAEDPLGLKLYDQKLGNAPYYAAKRIPTVHHTMGGLKIDTSARVIDTEGNVIPGFYAAGEVTGDIHGGNRLGGNAITDINVFGRIAGENAAQAN